MRYPEQLQEFLDFVVRLTGAEQATMALHTTPLDRRQLFLAGDFPAAAPPELADEDAAWQFLQKYSSDGADSEPMTVASSDSQCALVRIAFRWIVESQPPLRSGVEERRRQPDVRTALPCDGALWIGLRSPRDVTPLMEELAHDAARKTGDLRDGRSLTGPCLRMIWSIYHLSQLLQDPVSRLPGRMELQVFLARSIETARRDGQSIGLMLVNPDDFSMINHRFGRRCGDDVVRQVAAQLENSLRKTDAVFHYGGAIFAAVLPATEIDQCQAAAEKVRGQLAAHAYQDGTVSLTFSIGAAVAAADTLDDGVDLDLVQCADGALDSARISGGARIVVVDAASTRSQAAAGRTPVGSIFAADTEKDYRNMLLLWETVALMSAQSDPQEFARTFVDRLAIAFRPDRVALIKADADGFEILASNVRDESAASGRASDKNLKLNARQSKLVDEARESRRVARFRDENGRAGFFAYAVPLLAGDAFKGCLYLDAQSTQLRLDSSDVVFLNGLAAQVAVAMDRAELAARWIAEKDQESRKLREEVRDLRQALKQTQMVYRSAEMHAVMETLRKVAPSDATVLIIGESGTGKEMLAQSLHQLSNRRKAPFVVFDCGAVAPSLIEAELFGHTRGAFTGAEKASPGRIAQAQGGTLFLDEIGELPLSVQAKLLRFVQEREYSQVGSSETCKVDVRIVAATNRELQHEVGQGRFRSDLYYRLRVIAVQAVPLRERTDDILPLAQYFLEKFSSQHGLVTRRLSQDAEARLLSYHWPGNVRELQHAILRAVLTQESEVLDGSAIELFPESPADERVTARRPEPVQSRAIQAPERPAVPSTTELLPDPTAHPTQGETYHEGVGAFHDASADPWVELQRELERQVGLAVETRRGRPVPIGRWLNDDIIRVAYQQCNQVSRQAAHRVGVPESTFRRQLEKVEAGAETGMDFRAEGWEAVPAVLRRLIADPGAVEGSDNLLVRARETLLECVNKRANPKPSTGAALMGVSPPTYKRWIGEARA